MKLENTRATIHRKSLPLEKIIPLILLTMVVGLWGCSHTRPYYGNPGTGPIDMPATEDIRTRLILIGDAGAPKTDEPALKTLEQWASQIPERTHVFFLGDNLYPDGMVSADHPWRAEAERRLNVQIAAVRNAGAEGIFIPGNHDWATYGPEGASALRMQENYIEEKMNGEDRFLPSNGKAGPVRLDIDSVSVVILDSHRWIYADLHKYQDAEVFRDSVMTAMTEMLSSLGERPVVVLGHHPLATHGPHGGFFGWEDHIFPLRRVASWLWIPTPLIGSVYPLARWHLNTNDQDINGPNHRKYIESMYSIFEQYPPLLYVAGHEHSLQVIDGDDKAELFLVSGAGSEKKKSVVGHGINTLFSHEHSGFMVVDFTRDERAFLQVVEPAEEEVLYRYEFKR